MVDFTILKLYDNLILPLESDLDDNSICNLQMAILRMIEQTSAKGLLIDVSKLNFIDSFLGRILMETSEMTLLMGTITVLVGLKKEVVLSLIHLGLSLNNINAVMTLEQGIELLDTMNGRLS